MNNVESANRIKSLCRAKDIPVVMLLSSCGIRKGLIYDMEKRNKTPSAEILEQIADYLGCSVDYLLGRTQEAGFQPSQFSEDETMLISLYRQLNPEGREKILDSADDLVASGKYKKSGTDFVGAQAV